MNLLRTTRTPGIPILLLLLGGCGSLVESGAPAVSAVDAPAEQSDQAVAEPPPATLRAPLEAEDNPPEAAAGRPLPGAAGAPAPEVIEAADLWQRLRSHFRLSDRQLDTRRLRRFEAWYSAHPKYFERLTERARWFLPYVLDEVEKRGMPGEIALLPAIESAFRPDAVSRSHAVGMWQFIASTGRRFGLRQDWWMDGRRDLIQSTRAALDYLDFLQQEFNGDWELALAAYNAGEGAVRRQMRRNLKSGRPAHYTALKLRRETADYVPKLLAVRNIIAQPHQFGITLDPLPNRPALAVVDAKSQTDLSVAAETAGAPAERLHYLNQGYRRGTTPPNGPHTLVVPVQYAAALSAGLSRLGAEQRLRWARHRVREGENLSVIAHKYGVPVKALFDANGLTSSLIHPKRALRIPLSGRYQFAGAPPAGNDGAGAKTHTVQRGDSLWRIAQRYRVSVADLTRWNRIARDALLHPGQRLVVGR